MVLRSIAFHPYSHTQSCGPPLTNSGTCCECVDLILKQVNIDGMAKSLTHPRPSSDMILSQSQTPFSYQLLFEQLVLGPFVVTGRKWSTLKIATL